MKEVTAELLRLYRLREDTDEDDKKSQLAEKIKALEWVLESGAKKK